MKAAVLEAPNRLAYKEIPDPEPVGERSVLVRVGGVGVCGSDLLRFAHGTAYHYPLVLGHEFSAVVDEVPDGSRFAPGDKVAVFPLLPREGDPFTQIGEWALGAAYDYFGSRATGPWPSGCGCRRPTWCRCPRTSRWCTRRWWSPPPWPCTRCASCGCPRTAPRS